MTDGAAPAPEARKHGEPPLAALADRLVEALLALALVATPLLFDVRSARPFEPLKALFVQALALAVLGALTTRAVERRRGAPPLATPAWREPVAVAALLLALTWCLSTAQALSPRLSLFGSFPREAGLATLLAYVALGAGAFLCLRTRRAVQRLVDVAIVGSVPVALIGLAQRYGIDPLGMLHDPRRVAATLGAPNFAGSYAALVLPLTLARLAGALGGERRDRAAVATACACAATLQLLLVVFTQSRGPLLGLLAGGFVLGLAALLELRRAGADPERMSGGELARAGGDALAAGLFALAGAALGFLGGRMLEQLGGSGGPLGGLAPLGLGAGTLAGGAAGLVRSLRDERRRRRAFAAWTAAAAGALLLLGALNLRGTPLDVALDPLRRMPLLGRLAQSAATEGGSVRVRLVVWEAALRLVGRRAPIGIPGSELAPPDPRHALRPLVGYGADSLYLVFPAVEPPELAELERPGSIADRAHNETIDALVMHGFVGALALYAFWCALLARGASLLGWLADRAARRRLALCLGAGGAAGALLGWAVGNSWTLVPLGLPLGLVAGFAAHLALAGIGEQRPSSERARELPLLEAGLVGLVVAQLVQVHFVFPVAATHVLAAVAAGALAALTRPEKTEATGDEARFHGYAVAAVVALLLFAYARAELRPAPGRDRVVVGAVALVTWGLGAALTAPASARRHALAAASGLAALVALALLQPASLVPEASAVVALSAARASSAALLAVLVLLVALAFAMARALSSERTRRDARAWIAPTVVALAVTLLLWSGPLRRMRADVAMGAGDRAARAGAWEIAAALHERARALSHGAARCSLALAGDWQGAALDPRTPEPARAGAWARAEAAARAAWAADPYDADGPANLGRLLLSRAERGAPELLIDAESAFEATHALAPLHPALRDASD